MMRRVPSPVVVITARGPAEARGITIGSFTSLALEPPLVSFNVGCESRMHKVMEASDRFAVHVLGEGQTHLAKRFAVPGVTGAEQFESVAYQPDAHGVPVLDDVSAVFHCVTQDSLVAGDHELYVGRVVELEERLDRGAVLYYQSGYHGVGRELPSREFSPVKRLSSESS